MCLYRLEEPLTKTDQIVALGVLQLQLLPQLSVALHPQEEALVGGFQLPDLDLEFPVELQQYDLLLDHYLVGNHVLLRELDQALAQQNVLLQFALLGVHVLSYPILLLIYSEYLPWS